MNLRRSYYFRIIRLSLENYQVAKILKDSSKFFAECNIVKRTFFFFYKK